MIDLANKRMPRHALFLAFNAFALLFLTFFVFAPLLAHFVGRSDDIDENAALLSHFQTMIRGAKTLIKNAPHAGDPFLPGSDERIVSADLQASLKAAATTSGVRLIGIRSLPASRSPQMHMVAASVEFEGSLSAIRDVILAMENRIPFLFVTAATMRSVADGEDGLIRAELKVQGAMRDNASPDGDIEVSAQ